MGRGRLRGAISPAGRTQNTSKRAPEGRIYVKTEDAHINATAARCAEATSRLPTPTVCVRIQTDDMSSLPRNEIPRFTN